MLNHELHKVASWNVNGYKYCYGAEELILAPALRGIDEYF